MRIGSERRRLPVAAKMALVTAGWIMVAPGSPMPPQRLPGVGDPKGVAFRITA
jgi:hypothetical protein